MRPLVDINELLRRASSAPLGPLYLTIAPDGPDSWSLTVSMSGRNALVRARHDEEAQALVLSCTVDAGDSTAAVRSLLWVVDTRPTVEAATDVSLWLHDDGISVAMLLNALACLARLAVQSPSRETAPQSPATEANGTSSVPEPVPTAAHRPVGWQSLASQPLQQHPSASQDPPPLEDAKAANGVSHQEGVVPPADNAGVGAEAGEALTSPLIPSQAVPEPEPKPAGRAGYCRECGSPHTAEHVFCTNCGARLN